MTNFTEQFSAATKANIEAQVALFSQIASKTFEGVEKLVDLNLKATKSSLEEGHEATQKLLTAKDAQEFFILSSRCCGQYGDVCPCQPGGDAYRAFGGTGGCAVLVGKSYGLCDG